MTLEDSATVAPQTNSPAKWRPLSVMERRILGVLVEKAKTTPDGYPMSLNALVTGCNQKSNRDPQLNLTDRNVEDALVELRTCGAVTEVQGSGRVPRYRHHMKEWLGVEGVELAIMAELLLRGSQTVGDLRGRAARKAPGQLPDVNALKPVLDALIAKNLVLELSPPGRGQVVTHGLYPVQEMERERQRVQRLASFQSFEGEEAPVRGATARPTNQATADWTEIREELAALRSEVDRLTSEVAKLKSIME